MFFVIFLILRLLSSSSIDALAEKILSTFTTVRALQEFALYKQLPPLSSIPLLGSFCFSDPLFRPFQRVRDEAAGRFVVSYSSLESQHHGGNFARKLLESFGFPIHEFLIVPDFPCADVWMFRSFPPRNFHGVLIFSDAEKNYEVSGFPFLSLYPWVVYLGNRIPQDTFARQFWMPFGSSHLAQRRDPGQSAVDLLSPSATRVPLAEKTKSIGYLAHNCVDARDRAFARLCAVLAGACEALGRCPRGSEKGRDERYGEFYLDEAVELYREFKFALVFENAISEGYVTEKIVNAFLAGAVPIYAGDRSVFEIFDSRAFVFVEDVESDSWVEEVHRLASDDVLYEAKRGFVPVVDPTVFSWRPEVGNHTLGRAIVDAVRDLADQAMRKSSLAEQMRLAKSHETLLATTEFPGGFVFIE